MPTQPAPFVVPDYRRPDQQMEPLGLKLPQDSVVQLKAQAERLGTTASALGRALLLQGLEQLAATAPEVE